MKNLIIIIGTIILGAVIVNTLVLGDGNSLRTAADNIMKEGNAAISNTLNFSPGGTEPGTAVPGDAD